MKRMTKVLLVAALCFAITGAAFGIVSVCTGFTIGSFQKAVNAGDFTWIGPSKVTQEVSGFVSDLSNGNVDIEQTYRDIESMKLQIGAAECRIILWDEEEWLVQGYNMPNSFTSKKSGDWLKIDCTRSGMKLWEKHSDTVLEIYVPQDAVLEKVELDSGVGEISVEGGILICEELELQCGVGECDITADIQKKAEIEGGVGEVRLTLLGTENNFNFDLECGLGSVELGGTDFGGAGVSQKFDNGADREIRLECGIGSVEIQFVE